MDECALADLPIVIPKSFDKILSKWPHPRDVGEVDLESKGYACLSIAPFRRRSVLLDIELVIARRHIHCVRDQDVCIRPIN